MLDKHTARAAWFRGFEEWQTSFNDMLDHVTKSPEKAQTLGKTFLHDVMVPFMDEAKDRLLVAIAKDIQASCEKAKHLDGLVNKDNV